MRRRSFLTAIGCAASPAVAGCMGDPAEIRINDISNPLVTILSEDGDDQSYTFTLQNEGIAGDIRLEYYFFESAQTPNPDDSALFGGDNHPEIYLDRAEYAKLEAGETRTFSIERSPGDPGEDHGIFAHPAEYQATIENEGGSGEIDVYFEVDGMRSDYFDDPEPKRREIDSNEKIEVRWNEVIPLQAQHEVYAEPV